MKSDSRENLEALLRRVEAGELDSLTPEQIDALEAHLNAMAGESKPPDLPRLGGRLALPDAALPDLAIPDSAMPTPAEWERVWNNIEAGVTTVPADATPIPADRVSLKLVATAKSKRSVGRRVIKFWPAWAAVAACVALLFTWHFAAPPVSAGWEMQLADQVEVDELDVFGDATAFVDFNDDGTAMIWVFEGNGA